MNLYNKSLKSFSDDELYEILTKNEVIESSLLAFISSEILRRIIEKEKSKQETSEACQQSLKLEFDLNSHQ